VHCLLITPRRWYCLHWQRSHSCCIACGTSVGGWRLGSVWLNVIFHHLAARSSSSSSSGWLFMPMPFWICWRHSVALTCAKVFVHQLDDSFLRFRKTQVSYFTSYWILWATSQIHCRLVYILPTSTTHIILQLLYYWLIHCLYTTTVTFICNVCWAFAPILGHMSPENHHHGHNYLPYLP